MADYAINVSTSDRQRGGEYLIKCRENAGLKAREVAAALGITKPHMSNMERGKTPIKPAFIGRLADMYGVPQAEFAKRVLRYRDPLMYAMIFGVEGDRDLEVTVEELMAAAEGKSEAE